MTSSAAFSQTSSTPSSFHLFPQLPYELRLKIYSQILYQPRTISINCEKGVLKPTTRRYIKCFKTDSPIPPLLHVSHETRQESLKHYTPHFHTSHSPNYIHINFTLDTIKLGDGILGYLLPPERDGIQRMTLEVHDSAYFGYYNIEHLVVMKGLRELEIVAGRGEIYSWNRESHYLTTLTMDLVKTRADNPEWNCPRIRIVSGTSGEEVGVVEGGCWTEEEEEMVIV